MSDSPLHDLINRQAKRIEQLEGENRKLTKAQDTLNAALDMGLAMARAGISVQTIIKTLIEFAEEQK